MKLLDEIQDASAEIRWCWLSKPHSWTVIRNCNLIITFSPSCSGDFDDLTPASAPPEWRQGPVGTTRASRPALFREQKDLRQTMSHFLHISSSNQKFRMYV